MLTSKYMAEAKSLPSWDLTPRQLCDLEMLLSGAFKPLNDFLGKQDYESVLDTMHLANGELWPMPINLDVSQPFADSLELGQKIALRDSEGVLLAIMQVDERWMPDKYSEALAVFGTVDPRHPGVDYLFHRAGDVYLAGQLTKVELPLHYDYRQYRYTPDELKAQFKKLGWRNVLGFHTCHVMHQAEQALTFQAARAAEANLLIQPVVGLGSVGTRIDHFTRVRCYEQVLNEYPEKTTLLSLLPLAVRMAGPREALWHTLIRKNYGCTHFMVSPFHANPEMSGSMDYFYSRQAAQTLVKKFEKEMAIKVITPMRMVYVQERGGYIVEQEGDMGGRVQEITPAELRRRLELDLSIPEWFSYPGIIRELRKSCPPRHQQGFTVFFTGLSGSGKSTVANALVVKLLEIGGRPVTLLDGDVVRKNLSSELTFSKEHRDLNIRRIGFVASEITKNGGIAVCAPIAPYAHIRREVRNMVSAAGGFVEVHVSTPLEECERRDRKGLYAKARAGLLKQFTGIDDPYEIPEAAELVLDTTDVSPDECAHQVLLKLENIGFLKR